jgi:hypothetical protein
MEKQAVRIIFSISLIALGVVILLDNLNLLPFDLNSATIFWAAAFAVGGLAFLAAFFSNPREVWWAAIPGFTLLGLAGVIGMPKMWDDLSGGLFLGMIGLSFLVIYLIRRDFWWAVIPGGVLATLAVVALTSSSIDEGTASGGLFFLGLAATFLVVYFLPTPEGRMQWALWPAGILGLIGMIVLAGAGGVASYIFPLFLVGVGGFMIFRAMRR